MSLTAIADRLARLSLNERNALVLAPNEGQPFSVPQFRMSSLFWLEHLADRFFDKHQRCMCIALMLDLDSRDWNGHDVPTQRCAADGVHWTWLAEDFADRGPNFVIAGTFQTAVLDSVSEAIALVPPTDGVHLISARGPNRDLYIFMRVGGRTLRLDYRSFVVDDVDQAMDSNAVRLLLH